MLFVFILKELRTLYRDRQVLVYGVLLPVLLYPVLLFGVSQIKLYTQGLSEARKPRVAIAPHRSDLHAFLEARDHFELRALSGSGRGPLHHRSLELVLTQGDASDSLEVGFDSRRERSIAALRKILPLLEEWRGELEMEAGRKLGIETRDLLGPPLDKVDVVDPELRSRRLLAMMLPLILLVMCTFSATYPALELTAGERERRSAETTALLPLPRRTIALGKSLAVTLCTFQGLCINLAAIFFTAGPLFFSLEGKAEAIPSSAWLSLPLILGFGLLVSMVLANVFLLVGSYARNFREAQAFATPVQILALAPGLMVVLPEARLDVFSAMIPIYNTGLVFRSLLLGQAELPHIHLCLASMSALAILCFRATVHRLQSSAFALGIKDPDQVLGWER